MKNWEATHECEDKCDEERLCKRAAITSESSEMTKSVNHLSNLDSKFTDIISLLKQTSCKDFIVLQTIQILEQSRWLMSNSDPIQNQCSHSSSHLNTALS